MTDIKIAAAQRRWNGILEEYNHLNAEIDRVYGLVPAQFTALDTGAATESVTKADLESLTELRRRRSDIEEWIDEIIKSTFN